MNKEKIGNLYRIQTQQQQQQTPRNRIETETQIPENKKKCNQTQCVLLKKAKHKKREKIEKYVFIRIKKIQTILIERLLFVTFCWRIWGS